MKTNRIGTSQLAVSAVCLGTMTFGTKTPESDAIAQLDYATDHGVDFIDTAELYPVPPDADYAGNTEKIVGRWLKGKSRDSLVIATKIAGPELGWFKPPIRSGKSALDRRQIILAVEGSLKRLNTDYIDLYQTHWPDHSIDAEETLRGLEAVIDAGKVRVAGCSNETCWGLMKSLEVAREQGLPKMQSVQNNFSLLNRRCLSELAQVCRREQVSLLPYSPLAGGMLSGKYNDAAAIKDEYRFAKYINSNSARYKKMAARFVNPRSIAATEQIIEIARDLAVDPLALALAWTISFDFVASTIVGATTLDQLKISLQGADLKLSKETLKELKSIEREIPLPYGEDGLRYL